MQHTALPITYEETWTLDNIKYIQLHKRYLFDVHGNFWSCRRKKATALDDVAVEEDREMVKQAEHPASTKARTHELNMDFVTLHLNTCSK